MALERVNKFPAPVGREPGVDECAPGEEPQVIAGAPAQGDIVRDGSVYCRYKAPRVIQAVPRVLTKTQFMDHAVSKLGGGAIGMARFTAIMDATKASAAGAVRFAFARYEAAATFEKANTGALTSIMAADSQTGHLTADERTAILDNWPTA